MMKAAGIFLTGLVLVLCAYCEVKGNASPEGLDRAHKDIAVLKVELKTKTPEQLIFALIPRDEGYMRSGGYDYYEAVVNCVIKEELGLRGRAAVEALRMHVNDPTGIYEGVNGPGYSIGRVCKNLLEKIPGEADLLLVLQVNSPDPDRQAEAAERVARRLVRGNIAKDDPKVLGALKGVFLEGRGEASYEAMAVLCWMGMPAFNTGLEGLRSTNPRVKGYGAQLLGNLAEQFPGQQGRFEVAIAELTKYIYDKDKFIRVNVIQALAHMGPKAIPPLTKALGNPPDPDDPFSRDPAAVGLARMGKTAVPALIETLRSSNPVVRRNAAFAFAHIPEGAGIGMGMGGPFAHMPEDTSKDVVAALIDATRDKVADVRREAACALGMIRPGAKAKAAGPRLIEMMEHGEGDFSASLEQVTIAPELVDRALGLLAKYPKSRLPFVLATAGVAGVPKLIAALSSDSLAIQRGAAQALGLLGAKAKPAVPALIKALGQPNLYGNAAWALGSIGPEAKEAVPALMACLEHDQWPQIVSLLEKRMRISPAANALGCIGSSAVPELLRGLESNSDLVQAGSVQALARAGMDARDKVVPAVLTMVKRSRHPVVKGLAIETLLHLPADKEDLLPLLETLAKDPDPRVVRWAHDAKVYWTNNQFLNNSN